MKRGEIWWINFDPSLGGEVKKMRPAIIVSNDASNRHLNRVQVVPLSGNTTRVYPSDAVVAFGDGQSKAMADQLTTACKQRLVNRAGKVSVADMRAVDAAIRVQLALT